MSKLYYFVGEADNGEDVEIMVEAATDDQAIEAAATYFDEGWEVTIRQGFRLPDLSGRDRIIDWDDIRFLLKGEKLACPLPVYDVPPAPKTALYLVVGEDDGSEDVMVFVEAESVKKAAELGQSFLDDFEQPLKKIFMVPHKSGTNTLIDFEEADLSDLPPPVTVH